MGVLGVVGSTAGETVDAAGWLRHLPAPAVVLAPDGRVFGWNADAADLLGWGSVRHPQLGNSQSTWLIRLREAVAFEGRGRVVISRRRRDGSRAKLELNAARHGDRDMLVILNALTDRAMVSGRHDSIDSAAPRMTQERLQVVAEAVRDHAILVLDAGGSIVRWNSRAEELTGYADDEIIRAHLAVLLAACPEEVARHLSHAAMRGRAEFEANVRRQDRSTFSAHVTIIAFTDPDERLAGFVAVARDLSEQLRVEENLRRSEEQLRHSQKMDAVGRLASGIAHDFKNVLTAIQGHAQFILEDLPADVPSHEDAEEILKATESATELTRQLLTFARKQPSKPVLLNPNLLITDVEKLLRRLIRADVVVDMEFGEVPNVLVDPGQLEQVVVNLVVNARDAIGAGGRIMIGTSRIRLDEKYSARGLDLTPGDYVQIVVSDTGTGMCRETQRQIFEPFFTTKKEGTGLGLPTVYGIVKQAGGHVSVYSEPGHGATFKVFLPAYCNRVEAPVVRDDVIETGTVLLVEDDDSVRALAKRTLEAKGFFVVEATDGEEALRIASSGHGIDVVVTDLTMPRLNGEELAVRIRETRPDAGIVMMSGFSQLSLEREGRIQEGGHFLEKPFTPSGLIDVVREAMNAAIP